MLKFRLACLVLAVSLAYVPGIPSGATAPKWWVLALGLAVVLWKLPRDGGYPGLPLVAALLAWCTVGFLWTATPWDTGEGLVAVALLGMAFVLGGQTRDLSWCWEAAALSCWLQIPSIALQLLDFTPVTALGVSGLMFSKNLLAEFALAAGVGVLFTERRWLVIGPVACLALLWVRSPAWEIVLGTAVAFVVYVLHQPWRKVWLIPLAGLVVAVFVGGVNARLGSLGERLDIWEVTVLAAAQHPFGWGLNSFADAVPAWEFAHNDFLQIFFELGLPGLGFGGFVLWRAFSASGGLAEKCVTAALLGCACLWWPLRSPATALMAALAVGHLCGYCAHGRVFEFVRRSAGSFGLRARYEDLSPATVRAARAGGEVLPVRPQYSLVGREVSEHL